MSSYDSREIQLACQNAKCKKQIKVIFRDLFSSRRAKCGACGAEINFNSGAVSDIKYGLDDMVKLEDGFKNEIRKAEERFKADMKRAEEKVNRSIAAIMKGAEIKLKM